MQFLFIKNNHNEKSVKSRTMQRLGVPRFRVQRFRVIGDLDFRHIQSEWPTVTFSRILY